MAPDDSDPLHRPIRPEAIAGDIRKFSEYVLVPDHPLGKDRVFLALLGFRPRSLADGAALLEMYLDRAGEAVERGAYRLGEDLGYGVRCSIIVEVRGVALVSGWVLRSDGTLWLATPFSGFAGRRGGQG